MSNKVIVLYTDPRAPLQPLPYSLHQVEGFQPVRDLFSFLQLQLKDEHWDYVVLSHDANSSAIYQAITSGLAVRVFEANSIGPVSCLADLLQELSDVHTLAIFPEGSICPDVDLMRQMLTLHRQYPSSVMRPEGFPVGLLPLLIAADVVERVESCGLAPTDASIFEIVKALRAANVLQCAAITFRKTPGYGAIAVDDLTIHDKRSLLAAAIACRTKDWTSTVRSQRLLSELTNKRDWPGKEIREDAPELQLLPSATALLWAQAADHPDSSFNAVVREMDSSQYKAVSVLPPYCEWKVRAAGGASQIVRCDELSMSSLIWWEQALEALCPDVVHIEAATLTILQLAVVARKIPIVLSVPEYVHSPSREALSLADGIVCASAMARDRMMARGIEPERIHLYKWPLEDTQEAATSRAATLAKAVIGVFGPMEREYCIHDCVMAFAKVKKAMPGITAVIVDESTFLDQVYVHEVKQLIRQLKLEETVMIVRGRPQRSELLAGVDVILVASTARSNVHLIRQAMHRGKVLVGPNKSWFSEEVSSVNLFEAGDADDLAVELEAALRTGMSCVSPAQSSSCGAQETRMCDIYHLVRQSKQKKLNSVN